jgi:hypothetical protein
MTVGKIPLTPFRKGGILEKLPFYIIDQIGNL